MGTIQHVGIIERGKDTMTHEFNQVFNAMLFSRSEREAYEAHHAESGEAPGFSLAKTFRRGFQVEMAEKQLSSDNSPLTKKLKDMFAGVPGVEIEDGDTLDNEQPMIDLSATGTKRKHPSSPKP